jgi:hypothetical protein
MTKLPLPLLFSLLAVSLSSCASSPISRIDQDRAKYESWPIEAREGILAGEARKGMTPEQVEMALGKPTEVISRSSREGGDEIWVYRKNAVGSTLLNNTGISVGTGMGGVNVGTGIGGGSMGSRRSSEEQEVVFSNGVVVRSTTER